MNLDARIGDSDAKKDRGTATAKLLLLACTECTARLPELAFLYDSCYLVTAQL
jgi:hypothetical protein